MIQSVEVKYCYSVHFTEGVFDTGNPLLRTLVSGKPEFRVCAVVDSGVVSEHPGLLGMIQQYFGGALAGSPLVVPGGEQCKNDPEALQSVLKLVNDLGICRHSYLVAIGGGGLLDMAGFAAAIAHRGVRLIRIPTTVLAQNDSGVGVKNGINAFGKKNFIGTFAPPFAVVNDRRFLTTLSQRDWIAGTAEAVKVALLKDGAFFAYLEQNCERLAARDADAMSKVIYRCAEMHLNHIAGSGDPFEKGNSRPLDFGHWSAHKLEYLTGHALRHGEAVAIGIALDATYSFLSGLLPEVSWKRVIALLRKLGFPLFVPQLEAGLDTPDDPASLLRGLQEFREHLGGELSITLLRDIGHAVDTHSIDLDLMRNAIRLLQSVSAPQGERVWNQTANAA